MRIIMAFKDNLSCVILLQHSTLLQLPPNKPRRHAPSASFFFSNQAGVFWYGLIPFMTRLKQTCPTSRALCKLPRSHFIWSVRFLQPWPLPLASPISTCVWRPGMHLGQIAVIRRALHIVPACCYLDTSSPGQPATPQEAARVFDAVRQFDHECPSSFSGSPAYTHHA